MTSRQLHGGIVLAVIPTVAALTLASVGALFRSSPDAELYARAADRTVRLSENAPEALQALIDRDEVTWDPTGGWEMPTVLAHLKAGPGARVLLVGSSQLLWVRGDRSMSSVGQRVDRILEDVAKRPVTVYNLSLCSMNPPEKAIVLEHASRAVRLDEVVVALTLADSLSGSSRGRLDSLTSASSRKGKPFGASDDRSGPASVNRRVAAFILRVLHEHVAFFRDRMAIQAWLGNSRPRVATPSQGAIPTADGRPIQYLYSDEELGRAVANVRGLLQSTAALRGRAGFHVSVLLTPVRQDVDFPPYDRQAYAAFRASVRDECRRWDFDLIDASELLDPTHFGLEEYEYAMGRIDVLHFDARGHEILAEFLASEIGLNGRRAAQDPAMRSGL